MTKLFGITILLFGFLAVIATYKDLAPFWLESSETAQIETLWKQDIELLVRTKSLPKQWIEVAEITYYPQTESTKELLSKIRPPLGTHKDGKYKLEVTVDDWKDGSDYGVMIQYQMFDIASQNMIWELGRTLIIENSKVQKKSKSQDDKATDAESEQTPSQSKTE